MKVTFDDQGICLPDTKVEQYIENLLSKKEDIHVANLISIDCLRAKLKKMPVAIRPNIEWVFFGRQVHFDKDLRSYDAWFKETDISTQFLEQLF